MHYLPTQDRPTPDPTAPNLSSAAGGVCRGENGIFEGQRPPGVCWCTVEYAGEVVRVEWGIGRRVFGAGPWLIEVAVDGLAVPPPARWDEVCRQSEDGVEYWELEGRVRRGIRFCRQVVAARQDRFLLLADAIVLSRPAMVRYSAVLPRSQNVGCEPAAETRESRLVAGGRQALVLPLALPEWRDDPRGGELSPAEGGLALRQSAHGRALFAPLFIDLDAQRRAKAITWRPLTVAENFRIQPADVAVGYRVQIGSHQWLVYRSLGPKGNRSLLGHNLASETLIARFAKGEVEPLVEIE